MDDDFKDFKKNKPQQKLYKPGSGPLRRRGYGFDSRMNVQDIDDVPNRDHNNYKLNFPNEDVNSYQQQYVTNSRSRKPEQALYVPRSGDSSSINDKVIRNENSSQFSNRRFTNKQDRPSSNSSASSYSKGASKKDSSNNDINYNRHRQVSEPRSISPNHCGIDNEIVERNRDSRSMETSAGRHMSTTGAKPPSGRRNSAGYTSDSSRTKFLNLDNLPPRFRKKYLEQSGHYSIDNVDQINRDKYLPSHPLPPNHNSNSSWSQTLPSRGRGRLRDTDGFDRDKFISSYLKNYEAQNSRRSTPSSSYLNLYEPNLIDNRNLNDDTHGLSASTENQNILNDNVSKNGINNYAHHLRYDPKDLNYDLDNQDDSEGVTCSSNNLLDMKNLDWTEEVENNIKLDDLNDTTVSFSQNLKLSSNPSEAKPAESRESKRSGRSRRRDKRSLSRGQKNDKKPEKSRKDSNSSTQQETVNSSNLKHIERERRDSHKSNRSSTIGNSRDDLDRWRSLRSYSREQSTEGRIVSQCNSRDVSTNRALSPRDSDGFRVPSAMSKSASWLSANQKKNNSSWASGRTPSLERGRHSPAPSTISTGGEQGGTDNSQTTGGGSSGGGGGCGRKGRKNRGGGRRKGRNSENTVPPVNQPPGATPAPTNINWREEILESKRHNAHDKNSENSNQRKRSMSDKSHSDSSNLHPGLIILPQSSIPQLHKDQGGFRGGSVDAQKILYDHQNPSKPIIVQTNPSKIDTRLERGVCESSSRGGSGYEVSDEARAVRHRALLQEVDRADAVLHAHRLRGPLSLADHWHDIAETRRKLQNALQKLLMSDLKYCQSDNVEQHFWKILYYHFIEVLRTCLSQISPEDKPKIIKLLNTIIEEGHAFFENLVQMLEKTYKFSTEDYINDNHSLPPKGLGYLGLALISVQKLYVFLGDLARYKEQVNETNNYAKSKYWYTRAQQINPKNGRPYNQLAILAIYARRKLDAVYYYMRSLMSSNPFHSARESLISLFDENRKKYEAAERKRRVVAESSRNEDNAEDGPNVGGKPGTHGPRREVWIRPSGHRTTTIQQDTSDDRISAMTSVELNKNFITSYLHVHGKLITKIGMESFHESASQMLRQFRALLHRQPLPTPAARLLQLTALNMFAVETTASSLKDSSKAGERSAWIEAALGVSLLMFGAMLERCCALLPEPPQSQQHTDAMLLLPAIKVWSDWMLCHSSVWNPPPTFDNFDIGRENDPWDWLAKLMNILEALDDKSIELESEPKEGYVAVRLAEDASLAGFTPLMYVEPAAAWVRSEPALPPHAADHVLRTRKLLFFGTEYLVGVEPPVLRLEYHPEEPPRYVSAVQPVLPHHPPLQHLAEDSEEDTISEVTSGPVSRSEGTEGGPEADEVTRKLLRRKEQLESRKATSEKRQKRMQEILRGGWVSSEVEVRPRWLVPDTNCFIDHLPLLQAVAEPPYVLAVPLVVVTELEGLRKCPRVGGLARSALAWVCSGAGQVKLATTRGSVLAPRGFTAERDDTDPGRTTNDDRVLATALSLQQNLATNTEVQVEDKPGGESSGCLRRTREVVLLTDDRNLRVKAMAAELPTRDLQSFVQWAALTAQSNTQSNAGGDASVRHK